MFHFGCKCRIHICFRWYFEYDYSTLLKTGNKRENMKSKKNDACVYLA